MDRVKNYYHDEICAAGCDDPDEAAYWEAEGARIALEGMDLPDGAYFAMAEELGVDVFDAD